MELIQNKNELEFEREYNLGKEPLRVDLLIIKKQENTRVENEIGKIFKRFNILEYKSPDDGMSIDDYFNQDTYGRNQSGRRIPTCNGKIKKHVAIHYYPMYDKNNS